MTVPIGAACFIANKPRSVRPRPDAEPLTGLRRLWSEGKTAFRYREPQPDPLTDVATASLEDLVGDLTTAIVQAERRLRAPVENATIRDGYEIPSVSRQAYDATGIGVLSLDAPSSSEKRYDDVPGTIGAAIPADHPVRTAFRTEKTLADLTDEERAAYDEFIANRDAIHYSRTGIQYVRIDPLVAEQIEREREHLQTGPCIISKLVPTPDRSKLTIRVVTRAADGREFTHWFADPKDRAASDRRFFCYITDMWGRVPTVDDLDRAARWYDTWKTQIGYRPDWYHNTYLAVDDDPHREALIAAEARQFARPYPDNDPLNECQDTDCPYVPWHTTDDHPDLEADRLAKEAGDITDFTRTAQRAA